MKYLINSNPNDNFSLKYTVCVNDDVFEILTNEKASTEELAKFIGCEVDEIVQVELTEYEG